MWASTHHGQQYPSPIASKPEQFALPATRTVLAALGSSAAFLLGALYGLGAAVEARRLHFAHVSIADVLPQVPLTQLLTDGIGLLMESLVVLLLTSLTVVGLVTLEKRLDPYLDKQRRRMRTVLSRQAYVSGQVRELKAESKALDRIASEAEAVQKNPPHPVPPTTAADISSMRAQQAHLEQLLADAQGYQPRAEDLKRRTTELGHELDDLKRQVRLGSLPFKVFAKTLRWGPVVMALASSALVPLPLAASFWISALIWRLGRHTQIRVLLVVFYIVLTVGFVTDRVLYTSRLPIVTVTTRVGTFSGTLVLIADSTWYVAATDHVLRAFPASNVVTSTVKPATQDHGESFGATVLEALPK